MKRLSFARMRHGLYVMAFAFALSAPPGRRTLPWNWRRPGRRSTRPQADADQYAPDLIGLARQGLEQAQRAAGAARAQERPAMALRAAADADLARVRSEPPSPRSCSCAATGQPAATPAVDRGGPPVKPMTAATLAALLALPTWPRPPTTRWWRS